MSVILTPYDIEFMKNSVRDVIDQWHTTITIMQPLPVDKQPNYNKLMKEFTGDVLYETISISAERKDIVNNYTNNMPPDDTEYGEKNAGTILYAIPNILPVLDSNGIQIGIRQFKPDKDAIIAIDDTEDRYYISSMRDRIGEVLITVKRYTGDIPDGSENIDKDKVPIDGLSDVYVSLDKDMISSDTVLMNMVDEISSAIGINSSDVAVFVTRSNDWSTIGTNVAKTNDNFETNIKDDVDTCVDVIRKV